MLPLFSRSFKILLTFYQRDFLKFLVFLNDNHFNLFYYTMKENIMFKNLNKKINDKIIKSDRETSATR